MTLYTLFFEHLGSIHIRQTAAPGPKQAAQIAVTSLSGELNVSKEALSEAMEDSDMEAVQEYENIWSMAGCLDDSLLLVHIIATAR
jgi:hypothetical protein